MRIASQKAARNAEWERALAAEREKQLEALVPVEGDLAALERAKEPWGDGEIERLSRANETLKDIDQAIPAGDPLRGRVDGAISRLHGLKPRLDRALVLQQQREKQRAAEAARKAAEQARQMEAWKNSPEGREYKRQQIEMHNNCMAVCQGNGWDYFECLRRCP